MALRSVFREHLFTGRVAIVTGGGTGIGKAIARELLSLDCNVVIASRKLDRLEQAAHELQAPYPKSNLPRVLVKACNIREELEVQQLMQTTMETYGKVDYLVNNGGGQFLSPASGIRKKGWHAVVETNLTGTFLCCREAYNAWMKDHGGAIVNIVANMWKGCPGMAHTGAARAGVVNLTKTLAIEWASSGVRINSVAPGTIYSETAIANYKEYGEVLFNKAKAQSPAKRLGTPEEIIITFLHQAPKKVREVKLHLENCQQNYKNKSCHTFITLRMRSSGVSAV
uniref:peroxisomal trans-2-enoyl-CoA reductase isoform X2 n=1 Tax=Myxine glutinosa TaxID=7769 RepID=UPI00358F64B1